MVIVGSRAVPQRRNMKRSLEYDLEQQIGEAIGTQDASLFLTLSQQNEILDRIRKFKPDLTGDALLQAVQYIGIMSEADLFQAATYSSAYGFSFDTAAKLVIGGYDYPQAHAIHEMVHNAHIPIEDAKKYVNQGFTPEEVELMVSLVQEGMASRRKAKELVRCYGTGARDVVNQDRLYGDGL